MLWRRRTEGFEWKEYVRTTVLLRRRQRRDKIEAAGQAAARGLKEAGRAGLEAGVAGAGAAGRGAAVLAESAAKSVASGSLSGWQALRQRLARLHRAISIASTPLSARLLPHSWTLAGVGLAAAVASAIRVAQFGMDRDATWIAGVAVIALILALWPRVFAVRPDDDQSPSYGTLVRHARTQTAMADTTVTAGSFTQRISAQVRQVPLLHLVSAGLFAVVMVWLAAPALIRSLPADAPSSQPPAAQDATTERLTGSVRLLSDGVLKIGDTRITLDSLTLLDAEQNCRRDDGKSWPCGKAAHAALKKSVQGRRDVVCEPAGDSDGSVRATCTANGRDIGADLVRDGHAFADGLIWATYGSQQSEAQTNRAGLWAGDGETPDAWRARVWDEAVAKAPGGCPVKGRILGRRKIHIMPHDRDYDRTALRTSRGDAWFCSRDEAVAAGFAERD